jgi:hypothetical protein
MSKKLLNEATVRKFMKLANLANLSPTFLKEMQDEKVHEGGDMYEGEYMEEGGLPEEEDAMDAGPELGDEPEDADEPEMDEDDGEELAVAVLSAVADVFKERGVDIDVEGAGDEDEEGDEPDMGDEEDLMSPDEDEEGDEPPADEEDEEGPLQEAIFRLLDKSGIEIVDDQALTEAVVKRVAARVARRLLKESL